ncbi:MAG TPA: hypothetical protein VEQ59_08135 [Polyangiaceae bacterium]|nr:hypothetical protein [Polyangiaceae bacterium]
MGERRLSVGFAVAGVALALSLSSLPSCSTESANGADERAGAAALGDACAQSADCRDQLCVDYRCTKVCQSNGDCDSGGFDTCGVTEAGRRCTSSCDARARDVTCVDGVPTACSLAGEGHCRDCGCPSSQRCDQKTGACGDKRAVGDPCRADGDCKSDNCSDFAGICRLPVGSSCDVGSCDVCLTSEGASYCSRRCDSDSECGAGLCAGRDNLFYCHLPCAGFSDDSCPGTCRNLGPDLNGSPQYYCDCELDCTWNEAPHPLGSRCNYDGDCDSKSCDSVATGTDSGGSVQRLGICTKPCTASADCGEGSSCVAAGTAHCLPHCETSADCSVGSCFNATSVDGDTTQVCWPKSPEGAYCYQPSDCQSGNCVAERCASAGGQANGAACTKDEDCQSRACQSGHCRGQALQGDACEATADCAVGTCCSSGAQAKTCALSCE